MNYLIKILKLGFGCGIAMMIAEVIGLDYGASAGIIALLTLQDTKKETLRVSFKRVIAFMISVIIAYAAFFMAGYDPVGYSLFLFGFTAICIYFKMQDAIAMNAVLATHFLIEKNMSFSMIKNEAMILFIGILIGIILNLYIPSNRKKIRETQKTIEGCLKKVLSEMAENIVSGNNIVEENDNMLILEEKIKQGINYAYADMNNTFFQERKYFIEYMEMRSQQYRVLKEINEKIAALEVVTKQSEEVSEFINIISNTLSESQNTRGLLQIEKELLIKFKDSELPRTREEFETRAVLYIILMNFRIFLNMKKGFVDNLSDAQKDKYWE